MPTKLPKVIWKQACFHPTWQGMYSSAWCVICANCRWVQSIRCGYAKSTPQCHILPICYIAPAQFPQNLSLGESRLPPNTWCLGPITPNHILIESAAFPQYMVVTNGQTDRLNMEIDRNQLVAYAICATRPNINTGYNINTQYQK